MENNMHLDMFEQSCSINGKQMNGAADQPSVYPPARLGSLNVEENGDYAARTYGYDGFSNVHVDVAGSGGVSSDADVFFYDYDGTLLYSYTKEDFLALTAMPDNPSHEGLVALGWNWSLADAQAYVNTNGKQIIGQMYTTSDGRTRIYINLSPTRLSPKLSINLNSDTEVDIDWGDGSDHTTIVTGTNSATHTYASAGDYIISFAVNTGSVVLAAPILSDSTGSDHNDYYRSVQKAELGNGVKLLAGGFNGYSALRTITIPNTITSLSGFSECWSLIALIIPNNIAQLGINLCYDCYSLSVVSMPDSITSIPEFAFYKCSALSALICPSRITSIDRSCCTQAYALSTVVIPNSVTSIGDTAMKGCYSLRTINIPNSVTSIGSDAFMGTMSLTINIDNVENAISGAPWSADTHSVVNWLRSE